MFEALLLAPVDLAVEAVDSFEPESFDELDSLEPESFEPESFELDSLEPESLVPESFEELDSFEPFDSEAFDPPAPLADELAARESVLYQPLPLNTIPTG